MNREKNILSETGKAALEDEELGKVTGGVDESNETWEGITWETIRELYEAENQKRKESMRQIGTAEHAGTGGAAVMQGTFTGTDPFRP